MTDGMEPMYQRSPSESVRNRWLDNSQRSWGLNTLVRTGPFVAKRWRALDSSTPVLDARLDDEPAGPSQGLLVPVDPGDLHLGGLGKRPAHGAQLGAGHVRQDGRAVRGREELQHAGVREGVQNLRPQPRRHARPHEQADRLCSLISKPGARTTSRIIVHV